MTTSGTVGLTQYPVNKIIEQSLRRCGVATGAINAEMMQTGRDNLFLMLSAWSNRGINLWRIKRQIVALLDGVKTYTLPVGTVDLVNLNFKDATGLEIPMGRLNRDDYTAMPNKDFQTSRPTIYWYDRQNTPQVVLWPVPNAMAATGTLIAYCHMQIEDVGAFSNTLDLPQRWLNAVVTGLAACMMVELPSVDAGRLSILQAMAAQALSEAEAEETDSSPIFLAPDTSAYTR